MACPLPEKKICCAASAIFSRPSPRKSVAAYANEDENIVLVVPLTWGTKYKKSSSNSPSSSNSIAGVWPGSIFGFGEPASQRRQLVKRPPGAMKWDSFATVLRKEKSSAFQRKASVWTGLLKKGV